ncbi:MAG TPA: zinc-binding dehydrogenase [Syntrophales bacterium]|nr:zinc-binding dehydrogenase [Syntrophales bacterium]
MKTLYVETTPARFLAVKALRGLWPGVLWSRLSTLQYQEMTPPAPPAGWVHVKNHQGGICGSDLHLIFLDADLGVHPALLPGSTRKYLGHELVGHVLDAPPDSGFKPGDRVIRQMRTGGGSCLAHGLDPCGFCRAGHYHQCERTGLQDSIGGGLSDELFIPAGGLMAVPDDLADAQAVLVEPAACAIHGVLRAPPGPGESVLVYGAGTIAYFVLQVLRIVCPDCRITAIAEFPFQEDMARRCGADEVWLARDDLLARTAERTGGRVVTGRANRRTLLGGFDRIYDCVGVAATLGLSLRLARARGTVILIGVTLKPLTLDMTPVWYNEVNLMGSVSFAAEEWRGERIRDYDLAIRWMREGRLKPEGFVTHRLPLERYREAILAAVRKASSRSVKVVLEMGQG